MIFGEDNEYGGRTLPKAYADGTWEPQFAAHVKRELQRIGYGQTDATRQERIIAGFLLSEIFDGLNFRIDSSLDGTGR